MEGELAVKWSDEVSLTVLFISHATDSKLMIFRQPLMSHGGSGKQQNVRPASGSATVN
jgi:hypothetical protein